MRQFAKTAVLFVCFAQACGSSDDGSGGGSGGSAGTGGIDTSKFQGAPGVRVDGIAIYQGPKRTLMLGGAPQTSTIPLIEGRDTVLRVFYSTSPDYNGGEVVGRLSLAGGDPIEVIAPALGPASAEGDMGTTINFGVPGDRIGPTFSYSVGLLQNVAVDNAIARYPQAGLEDVPVEGHRNVFRMIIVPFQYNADGSGRLPDTSPEHIEKIRGRFKAMYPVSDVEITVHAPMPASSPIQANGTGWQQVGLSLLGLRGQDGTPDDVYYYAMFNPADTLGQYCGAGCVLGLTLLNNDPPSTGDVRLRGGLGVGFQEYAALTAAHEIGHSHGRQHAPCGPGVADIDPGYPHAGGKIGEWAYDVVAGQLIDPDKTDIMGYCMNQFISDYNYIALHNRGQNVNAPLVIEGPPITYDTVAIDGAGKAIWGEPIVRTVPYAGERVRVRVTANAEQGADEVAGIFLAWDHLPGGVVFVPRADASRTPRKLDIRAAGARTLAVR